MTTINITKARNSLYRLVDQVYKDHEPVLITGKRHNAVIISEEDWNSIKETLYLVSIPQMKESIQKGLKASLTECDKDLEW